MPSVVVDPTTNLRHTLSVYRHGRNDPTTTLATSAAAGEFWRATYTPEGAATLHCWWRGDHFDAQAWGPGAEWMLGRVASMTGVEDREFVCPPGADRAVVAAHRNHPGLRIGASGMLYHELLPVILAQRITAFEALRQWRRLCLRLGDVAPGPDRGLRLPPSPQSLLDHPAWWFHPHGVEAKRAEALRTVARHAARIAEWALLEPLEAATKLALLPGIGVWTIGSALGPALGDPDAVPVGDYHIPNMVAWALAREPRADDARMLALLAPYAGQRGRVIRLLGLDHNAAPKFGPRQRIQPMYRY